MTLYDLYEAAKARISIGQYAYNNTFDCHSVMNFQRSQQLQVKLGRNLVWIIAVHDDGWVHYHYEYDYGEFSLSGSDWRQIYDFDE